MKTTTQKTTHYDPVNRRFVNDAAHTRRLSNGNVVTRRTVVLRSNGEDPEVPRRLAYTSDERQVILVGSYRLHECAMSSARLNVRCKGAVRMVAGEFLCERCAATVEALVRASEGGNRIERSRRIKSALRAAKQRPKPEPEPEPAKERPLARGRTNSQAHILAHRDIEAAKCRRRAPGLRYG